MRKHMERNRKDKDSKFRCACMHACSGAMPHAAVRRAPIRVRRGGMAAHAGSCARCRGGMGPPRGRSRRLGGRGHVRAACSTSTQHAIPTPPGIAVRRAQANSGRVPHPPPGPLLQARQEAASQLVRASGARTHARTRTRIHTTKAAMPTWLQRACGHMGMRAGPTREQATLLDAFACRTRSSRMRPHTLRPAEMSPLHSPCLAGSTNPPRPPPWCRKGPAGCWLRGVHGMWCEAAPWAHVAPGPQLTHPAVHSCTTDCVL